MRILRPIVHLESFPVHPIDVFHDDHAQWSQMQAKYALGALLRSPPYIVLTVNRAAEMEMVPFQPQREVDERPYRIVQPT
jgi:hypothetical protein